MECCQGELFDFINHSHKTTLRKFTEAQAMKRQIPMEKPNKWIKSVQSMFKQICLGVEWMHNAGFCHLDLSLENTMIADMKTMKVKIIDFGLAKKFENDNFIIQGRIGKVGYMCPEAYARKKYDARLADVYCLGIMLFMMLIGAPIYQQPHIQQPAFKYMINGKLSEILKHWKRLTIVTIDAIDLLNNILRYQPKRFTLSQVLNHPFITTFKEDEEEEQREEEEEEEEEKEEEVKEQAAEEEEDADEDDDGSIHGLDSSDESENNDEAEDNDQEWVGLDDEDEDEDNDDDDDDMMKRYEAVLGNKEIDGNMLCQLLLTEWGLQTCYPKLKQSGWLYPSEWEQLTVFSLVYEVGVEKEEAQLFMKHLEGYLKYRQTTKR